MLFYFICKEILLMWFLIGIGVFGEGDLGDDW